MNMTLPDDSRGDGQSATPRPIEFAAKDGFPLHGDLFAGSGNGPVVLISAATGAPRTFYNKFAAWLVQYGSKAVLTYDYRGMPGSPKQATCNGRINLKDWALLDFPAAASRLQAHAPGHAMVGIGQSFGGHAFGLSGVADQFERYALIAANSGYFGNIKEPLKSYIAMNFVGIPVTWLLGRTARWMGLGEGIPATVFADWARWCRRPDYFFDDAALPETERFALVTTPMLSIGMTDDPWGTPTAIDAFIRHYEAAEIKQIWVSPQDGDGSAIGHLGFFRSKHKQTLWPLAGDWLLDRKLPAKA